MTEAERIEDQLRRAYEGGAWHGPALRELLADVNAERAAARPLANAHSIWEVVLHVAAWDGVVRRRAGGERVDAPPEGDWPAVTDTSEAAWQEALAHLERRSRELREAVLRLSDEQLDDNVGGEDGGSSCYVTLHGQIQHQLYHAGQIALLKKAQ